MICSHNEVYGILFYVGVGESQKNERDRVFPLLITYLLPQIKDTLLLLRELLGLRVLSICYILRS